MKSDNKQKKVSKVEKKLKLNPQEQKIVELTALLKQVQAEFENYKKRIDRDKEEFVKLSSKDIITKLLPFIDNFELALKNSNQDDRTVQGFNLIFTELIKTLQKEGLTNISTDKKFNPYFHEALMQEESDKEDNTILEVFQKGYMLGDRILRPSKVKVSKQKIHDNKEHS